MIINVNNKSNLLVIFKQEAVPEVGHIVSIGADFYTVKTIQWRIEDINEDKQGVCDIFINVELTHKG